MSSFGIIASKNTVDYSLFRVVFKIKLKIEIFVGVGNVWEKHSGIKGINGE